MDFPKDCNLRPLPTATEPVSSRTVAPNGPDMIDGFRRELTGDSSRTTGHVLHPTHTMGVERTRSKEESENVETRGAVPHGDFYQVISVMSKVNEGVVVTRSDVGSEVSATGRIVPNNKTGSHEADPTCSYIHFHQYGQHNNGEPMKFLLLPTTRSDNAQNKGFNCPINAGSNTVPVLSANESSSKVEVKKVIEEDSQTSNIPWDCIWLVDSTSEPYRRLYVRSKGGENLYMAADSAGRVFLTEDEVSNAAEKEKNPETYLYFYLKHRIENRRQVLQ